MRRLIGLLLFLVFVDDTASAYMKHMAAPMQWVFDWLLDATVVKVHLFDLIILAILLTASSKRDGNGPHVAPMKQALYLMLTTTVVWFLYGVLARGGDARAASWQTYTIVSAILLAFTVAATFRTAEHFRELAAWIVAAATYRAFMCWLSYFTWARDIVGNSGAYLTIHDDTIPWVISIIILVIDAFERRSPLTTLRNLGLVVFFLGAIQWNS